MENIIVPKKVYKFMSPYYLKRLEKNKKIYINHLNNYKEAEHGKEIGDDFEGTMSDLYNVSNYTFDNSNTNKNIAFERAIGADKLFSISGGGKIVFKNTTVQMNYSDKNYYNYCVCNEYDEKVKEEFGGSTLVIEDFPMFLNHLSKKLLKKQIRIATAGPCVYISDRTNNFDEKQAEYYRYFPALVKEKRYDYQKEFRVLWTTMDQKEIVKPIEVYCPEALQYCSFNY